MIGNDGLLESNDIDGTWRACQGALVVDLVHVDDVLRLLLDLAHVQRSETRITFCQNIFWEKWIKSTITFHFLWNIYLTIKHQIIPKPHPQISKYFYTCPSKNENIYKPDPDINQNIHIPDPDINQNIHIPDPDNNMDSLGRWLTPIHSHCLFSLAISPWTRIFRIFQGALYGIYIHVIFMSYVQNIQTIFTTFTIQSLLSLSTGHWTRTRNTEKCHNIDLLWLGEPFDVF